ncbi:MAG: hypothetical protein WC785_08655 [Tatlockia sp.]|jgi:hypothetical protein
MPLDKKSRMLIIHKGKKNLLALLQLKQPNNHDWAYLLLKKISGKNYGAYNLSAWEKWFAEGNKSELGFKRNNVFNNKKALFRKKVIKNKSQHLESVSH